MKYYFAPMEGITGYVYRNVHHRMFPGVDKYFTPFLSPGKKRCFTPRERRDVLPQNNEGVPLIPQILTNQAEDFVRAAQELRAFGYEEVNLNLGCPSGTVVSKGKGAGFLEDADRLDAFFEEVFQRTQGTGLRISVKTRIGIADGEEFEDLLRVFNRYPLEELIVHPRVRRDFYKNQPDWDVFGMALSESVNPVCYNGDIFSAGDYQRLISTFPKLKCVMAGRGLLEDPALFDEICARKRPGPEKLQEYHDGIYLGYRELLAPDERSVLFKMKEFWSYFGKLFPGTEREQKKIKKAQNLWEYEKMAGKCIQSMAEK